MVGRGTAELALRQGGARGLSGGGGGSGGLSDEEARLDNEPRLAPIGAWALSGAGPNTRFGLRASLLAILRLRLLASLRVWVAARLRSPRAEFRSGGVRGKWVYSVSAGAEGAAADPPHH